MTKPPTRPWAHLRGARSLESEGDPESLVRAERGWAGAWDLWIALCGTGAALYAPLHLVLETPHVVRLVAGALFTVVFAVDAVVPYRLSRRAGDDMRGFESGRGRPHPVRLAVDVVAAVPFLLFFAPAAILLWLLKLYRVAILMRLWRHQAIRGVALLRLGFFGYWMALLTHWATCGWITLRGSDLGSGEVHRYVESLYFVVTTVTTVGYGDVVAQDDVERLYAIALALLGVGVYGFVIGNIASLLANLDPGRVRHLQRMEELSAFMSYRNIPPALQARIGDYYRYLWSHRLDHDETALLDSLPTSLREEVSLYLKRDLLQAVPLFRGASDAFIREIALEMKPVFVLPGDYVIRAGERSRDMFFVSRGSLDVIGADSETILARLGAGDFFGEMALLYDEPRIAIVRAVEYCNLYRLEKDLFERVLLQYPEIAAQIRSQAEERRPAALESSAQSPPRSQAPS